MKKAIILLCIFFIFLLSVAATAITISIPENSPQADFAVAELQAALNEKVVIKHDDFKSDIILTTDTQLATSLFPDQFKKLLPEGFYLANDKKRIWIIAQDAAGLMYGGLEAAELIRLSGLKSIKNEFQNPYMAMRGTKFNIPLDARSPSYTDPCDAAQNNIGEMWSMDFWTNYIDNLARHRYNYISLWSLHPFPSLVRVPGYEDVALDDVQRSTVEWKEHYALEATGLDAPEILDNVEILKKISIDEKIEFWRQVMRYGKERNIDFYFITWNIFTNGTFGKYGITDKIDNPITRDYFRKSVKQMFITYPDLKGIGLTTGENMYPSSFKDKEDWAFATYAQGVLDAAQSLPDRKITFVHRQHMAGALEIADKFAPLIEHPNIDFIYSFKYAKAHVFSSTTQPYHRGFVKDIQGRGDLKTIWTLRNDDNYHFRWGGTDFVREFIQNIPYDVSRGYYYGSDQYTWGREFMALYPEEPRELEIEKHWYHWLLWGRLGYNPNISNERFMAILQHHFPQTNAEQLFTAWQAASMIYPLTTGFHWGSLDFQWYIEACQSRPRPAQTETGFHDVNRFITLPPHPGTDNISIPDYVKAILNDSSLSGTSPLAVAAALHEQTNTALKIVNKLYSSQPLNKELMQTLMDIEAMAQLGKYYAYKIEGATNLHFYRETADAAYQKNSISALQKAAEHWRQYAAIGKSLYKNPLWTNRVGYVNWQEQLTNVLDDIKIAGGKAQMAALLPSASGIVYDATTADFSNGIISTNVSGYQNQGYVQNSGEQQTSAQWTVKVKKSGYYIIEIGYYHRLSNNSSSNLVVNDKTYTVQHWTKNQQTSWVWDRVPVQLKRGKNTIQFNFEETLLFDYMNIIGLTE